MVTEFNYTNGNVRWLLSIKGNKVTVTCQGETRIYNLEENIITNTDQDNEYVFIFVEKDEKPLFYQFKFEEDCFLVGDKYDSDSEFIDSFASHVFGEEL